MANDPLLKWREEFPILSPGSREASVVALALREQFDGQKLWKFHATLLNTRGTIGKAQALAVAKDLGADLKKLEIAMTSPKIQEALDESKLLAEARRVAMRFRRHNIELFEQMYLHHQDRSRLIAVAKQGRLQFEEQMARERAEAQARRARGEAPQKGWDEGR